MEAKELTALYSRVRAFSGEMIEPLEKEDFVVQPIADVSPAKWHLAHVSWFFERAILNEFTENYEPVNRNYYYIFNSYYNSFGNRVPRPERGFLSRPTVDEVLAYRGEIDRRMLSLIESAPDSVYPELARLTELGCHHEQQHQELFFMDIKYSFWVNPLRPAYSEKSLRYSPAKNFEPKFVGFERGLREMGHNGDAFAYDNEGPRHKAYLHDYELMNRPVTNAEYLGFMEAGAYENPDYWLSDGWDWVQKTRVSSPEYWVKDKGEWHVFTLAGLKPLVGDEPVSHVSFFEADAFAKWKGKRLPTEFEWENAARVSKVSNGSGNFAESGFLHPKPVRREDSESALAQMAGDLWEWTSSAYLPYPGYKPERGALGEYNSKFMNDQRVLRGGSCATPIGHARITYRNFFQSNKRWPFTGIRVAGDA